MTTPAAARVLADPRWTAVLERRHDRTFVYSVASTGVYCRSGCGARRPRPEHVAFYPTPHAAERAGFRACRRCHPADPLGRGEQRIVELCRWIDERATPPTLAALSEHAGLSAAHLHRLFKRVTGLTPRAYAAGRRAERLRAALRGGQPVTRALHAVGYGSSSRLYEESDRVLGMTPTRFRAGGARERLTFAVGRSSLGVVLVARTGRGVCAVLLGARAREVVAELRRVFPHAALARDEADLAAWLARVIEHVEAPGRAHGLPLDLRGTALQLCVWRALADVPPGQTVTYAELARRVARPRAARAVAAACAANRVAVLVPCHRAVRQGGALAGYRWGLERKRQLQRRESTPG